MINVFTASSQKQLENAVFDKIKERLLLLRAGKLKAKRILLIVPAQFTLKAEEESFLRLGGPGFFDFHIMSGNKLIENILRETGGMGKTPINTLGRAMLLRKIAAKEQSELKRFSKICQKREFLKLAGDFIVQVKQNQLNSQNLEEIFDKLEDGSLLKEKLLDMKLLFDDYNEAMAGHFTDTEDRLAFATAQIEKSRYIEESEIWYWGFYSFTRQDMEFLASLAQKATSLNFMFQQGKDEIFEIPNRTIALLKTLFLEKAIGFSHQPLPKEEQMPIAEPKILRCGNPFSQAESIATEILRLVREEKRNFGEMAVLTADLPAQQENLIRILESYDIPLFMDTKRSVMHSPCAALLSYLLDMSADGMKENNVIGFLKQNLVDLADAKLYEQFENYVRRYHLKGKAFLNPLKYGSTEYDNFAELEDLRAKLQSLLEDFLSSFSKALSAEEKCKLLYSFLSEKLNLAEKLSNKANLLGEEGKTDEAEETAQSWKAICDLLEQTVELMGSENIEAKDFRDLLKDSLSDIKIGVLPQAEGKVQIGTITRSRLQNIHYLFIAGVNEGIIPQDANKEALLTEKELEKLEDLGYTLSKRNFYLAAEERFEIYNALSQPMEALWLCYCNSNEEGEGLNPSSILDNYPNARIIEDVENRKDPLPFLQGRNSAERRLFIELRKAADEGGGKESLHNIWKQTYNYLLENENNLSDKAKKLLYYDTAAKALSKEAVKELFAPSNSDKENFFLSPSRLEKYAECPFKHFIRYGLNPKEDMEFKVNPLSIGNLYHEALMELSKKLSEKAVKEKIAITDPSSLWMTIDEPSLKQMLDDILTDLSTNKFDGLFKAGKEESYRLKRVSQVCFDFAKQMVYQVRCGKIKNMYFERGFGRGKSLPALEVNTENGKVYIEGRIDRVDVLLCDASEEEKSEFIKILDYKSGNKEFKKDEVEKGLALQLCIYMEAALNKGENKPAGMFYFPIKEAKLDGNFGDLAATTLSTVLQEKLKKEYQLKGLAIDDDKILKAIDVNIENGKSNILPPNSKKNPSLIPQKEFDDFRAKFKDTLKNICNNLTQGEISPNPKSQDIQDSSCSYCNYKAICLYNVDKN